jgi:signal transduction histidine kinase
MNLKLRQSISSQLILSQLFAILLIIIVIGIFQFLVVRNRLYRQVESSGENLIQTMVSTLSRNPDLLTSTNLQLVVFELTAKIPNVNEITIVDKTFHIIASSDPAQVGQITNQTELIQLVQSGSAEAFYFDDGGKTFYRLSRGILGPYNSEELSSIVAAISVDMKISPVNDIIIRDFVQFMLVLVGVTFLFVLFMFGYIRRIVTIPLHHLTTVTGKIFTGNGNVRAKADSKDEIGTLGKTFNNMIDRLHEAQEQLVRRERLAVLGQLAGGVAHELRNPLGAIKNGIYFLNMKIEVPEPRVKETLDILEMDLDRTEKIITNLLDFARPRQIVIRKIDLNELVRETLTQITVPETVEVVEQLDKQLPLIFVDPDQMRQAFINLFNNAIQAMPDGGQLILKSEAVASQKVALFITDTGAGVAAENLKKLFEPLFTTRAKGIGLGLAITKIMVERHQGTLEVQSEEGAGSTFIVTLPLQQREEGLDDGSR